MTVYRPRQNPLLMTVMGANPGGPQFIVIDSTDGRVMYTKRATGVGSEAIQKCVETATRFAGRTGRSYIVFLDLSRRRVGDFVNLQWVRIQGITDEIFPGGRRSNPGVRRRRSPDDPIDTAISNAWHRLMFGIQVPILDIPRIFRDVKLEVAGGMPVEEAVMRVGQRYQVNRNPRTRTNASQALSWAAEVIADDSGEFRGNALRFATKEEAETYAKDLYSRWTAVKEWRVVESTDPVNRNPRGNPGLGAAVVGGIAGAVANRVLSNPPIQVPGDLNAACQAVLRCKACWAARPYAEAILRGDTMFDDPKGVLLYLRSNIAQWKGTEARIVKQVIDKYIKQGLSTFSNNPRFNRNMPVASVWDRLTDRQRQWALGFAGLPEHQIPYYVPRSWGTLPPKIQSAISAGWRENGKRRGTRKTVQANPGRTQRKTTMPIAKFAQLVKNQRDPALWRDFVAKCKAYHSWSHGTWPTKVTVERINKPGMKGLFIAFDMGKQPESTYIMSKGMKRKGAWKHPWTRMPQMHGDPQAGMIITKLGGGNRLTNFLHGN